MKRDNKATNHIQSDAGRADVAAEQANQSINIEEGDNGNWTQIMGRA